MRIFITGGTGFVGRRLARHFLERGHTVTTVGRSPRHPLDGEEGLNHIVADTTREGDWQKAVAGCQAVINLAGATIFRRWSEKAKKEIRDSRILTTRHLVHSLIPEQGTFLFSASGAGYYGDCGDRLLTEEDKAGEDFLAQLATDWEGEAMMAEARGARVATGRFGVILHPSGGALANMLPAFRLGLGGPLGNGRQYFPWIHIEDVVAAIDFLCHHVDARGAFNFCGPEPTTNRRLTQILGRLLHRPALLRAPAFVMRLALGEVCEVLLGSQRCLPQRLQESGFSFRYPTIDAALLACLSDSGTD
jgi:hypothetical protein